MLDRIPYGKNLVSNSYENCKHWYDVSRVEIGCIGCMERAGKQILVTFAHLINAVLINPILMIYDLVMSSIFLLANLCTAFVYEEFRERLSAHLLSALSIPSFIFKNLMATLWAPAVYHADDAIEYSYAEDHRDAVRNRDAGFAFQGMRYALRHAEGHPNTFDHLAVMSHLQQLRPLTDPEVPEMVGRFLGREIGPEIVRERLVSQAAQ